MRISLLNIIVTIVVLFWNNEFISLLLLYLDRHVLARTAAAPTASPDSSVEITSDGPGLCFEDEKKRQKTFAK